MDIEQRIGRLETTILRWRALAIVQAAGLAVVLSIAAAPQRDVTFDRITARHIEVISDGAKIELSADPLALRMTGRENESVELTARGAQLTLTSGLGKTSISPGSLDVRSPDKMDQFVSITPYGVDMFDRFEARRRSVQLSQIGLWINHESASAKVDEHGLDIATDGKLFRVGIDEGGGEFLVEVYDLDDRHEDSDLPKRLISKPLIQVEPSE